MVLPPMVIVLGGGIETPIIAATAAVADDTCAVCDAPLADRLSDLVASTTPRCCSVPAPSSSSSMPAAPDASLESTSLCWLEPVDRIVAVTPEGDVPEFTALI